MAIDVESVATDADLEVDAGGKARLQGLLPDEWIQTPASPYDITSNPKRATLARQRALDIVLDSLTKKRPPILPEDLFDVTELKNVVCWGALEIIYRNATEHDESPNQSKAKEYGRKFKNALDSLQPTMRGGSSASSLSIRISRC